MEHRLIVILSLHVLFQQRKAADNLNLDIASNRMCMLKVCVCMCVHARWHVRMLLVCVCYFRLLSSVLTSAIQQENGAPVRNGVGLWWRSSSVKVRPSGGHESCLLPISLSLSIGDSERKLSMPISFLCDRHNINIPESQKGAITNCPFT